MSRIGRHPIAIPAGVTVTVSDDNHVVVKGPKGQLEQTVNKNITVKVEGNEVHVTRPNDEKQNRAFHGLYRALIANMVVGVTEGFTKKLNLVGVGYKAQAQGNVLNLSLGFSHPVAYKMPEGIEVKTPTPTEIVIHGADKQKVGQVAAEVRSYREPEPYKGKGVRYADEVVIIKETKKK